jgi:hypothetical protein
LETGYPLRVTVEAAENLVAPRADKIEEAANLWRSGSLKNQAELTFSSAFLKKVAVCDLPRHKISADGTGNEDGELLRCPAVDVDGPAAHQREAIVVKRCRVVPFPYLGRVDRRLRVNSLAELANVLLGDFGDVAGVFIEKVSEGGRLPHTIESVRAVRHYQYQTAARSQHPVELLQGAQRVG